MLVLNRKYGEAIVLTVPPSDRERRIVVRHVGTRNRGVGFGTEAPPDVEVHREEIQAEIDARRASGREGG